MQIYEIIFENRNLLKLVYTLIIGTICFIIFAKTNKLFRISSHQGIRYFRNAFLFYGFGFILRYALVTLYDITGENYRLFVFSPFVKLVHDFFLVMAGFFLLYSLLWRSFENSKGSRSSLFNLRIMLFYILALIIALLDYTWSTYSFMYLSQIVVFSFAGGVCFARFGESQKAGSFFNFYFMVIILNFIVWTANFIISSSFGYVIDSPFDWQGFGVIATYALNLIIFSLFLYSILNSTKK